VKRLIDELLDPEEGRVGERMLIAERVGQIDTTDWYGKRLPLLRPMLQIDLLRALDADDQLIRAARCASWPEASKTLASLDRPVAFPFFGTSPAKGKSAADTLPVSRMFRSIIMPLSLDRFVQVMFRRRTEARLVATSLAIRMYRADHDGRWPEALEALVPQYLPCVPRDPMAEIAPLRFVVIRSGLPDGSDRPLIYSVGDDGIDDTAKGSRPPSQPRFSWSYGKTTSVDEWRDLKRWAPKSPAPPGVDENSEESVD
jgi:hypothetical protein